MPFTFSKVQKLVSIFVIFSFFLLLAISIFILKGNKLFVKKIKYHTFFNQTYGLSSGSPLKYKGLEIGKVTGIKLTKQNKILLDFNVYEEYRSLFREETVLKVSSGLIGSATLAVQPDLDKTHSIRPENSLIFSSDMEAGIKILNRNIKKVEKGEDITAKASQVLDMIADMKPKIYSILDKLNKTLDTFNGTALDLKEVSSSLKGEGETELANKIFLILDNLNTTTQKANSLISKFSSPDNSIGKFLSDKQELYNKIDKILDNLNYLLNNFQDLPDEIKDILDMTKENLVQLKYVLENVPLIPKKSEVQNITITSENR